MATKLSNLPSRSYEPLARRFCKGVYDLTDGNRSVWVPLTRVSQHIKVKDEEMLNGAMSFAARKGLALVEGQPMHSLMLTGAGEVAALKRSNLLFELQDGLRASVSWLHCHTHPGGLLCAAISVQDSLHRITELEI